ARKRKDWWAKKKVPTSEWKCETGPYEFHCTRWQGYEDDPEPCHKCKDKYWERQDYDEAKERYREEKMSAHIEGWRAVSEGSKGPGELLGNEYDLYVKGSELKMNGEVVANGIALGFVGQVWTRYHPEGKSPKPRPKNPAYEWRSEYWRKIFAPRSQISLEEERFGPKLVITRTPLEEPTPIDWEDPKRPEPMEIDQAELVKNGDDDNMEIDESVLCVECHNVQNYTDQRTVI